MTSYDRFRVLRAAAELRTFSAQELASVSGVSISNVRQILRRDELCLEWQDHSESPAPPGKRGRPVKRYQTNAAQVQKLEAAIAAFRHEASASLGIKSALSRDTAQADPVPVATLAAEAALLDEYPAADPGAERDDLLKVASEYLRAASADESGVGVGRRMVVEKLLVFRECENGGASPLALSRALCELWATASEQLLRDDTVREVVPALSEIQQQFDALEANEPEPSFDEDLENALVVQGEPIVHGWEDSSVFYPSVGLPQLSYAKREEEADPYLAVVDSLERRYGLGDSVELTIKIGDDAMFCAMSPANDDGSLEYTAASPGFSAEKIVCYGVTPAKPSSVGVTNVGKLEYALHQPERHESASTVGLVLSGGGIRHALFAAHLSPFLDIVDVDVDDYDALDPLGPTHSQGAQIAHCYVSNAFSVYEAAGVGVIAPTLRVDVGAGNIMGYGASVVLNHSSLYRGVMALGAMLSSRVDPDELWQFVAKLRPDAQRGVLALLSKLFLVR